MPVARDLVAALDHHDRRDDPTLVFVTCHSHYEQTDFDTPSDPIRFGEQVGASTEVMLASYSTPVGGDSLKIGADTRLEWVEKSTRNPFVGMITFGRTNNNDIVIDVPTVSKVHAIFARETGGWMIWDSNSTNGTYLDGVRLPKETKRAVDDGSEILFGPQVRAFFVLRDSLELLLAQLRPKRPR